MQLKLGKSTLSVTCEGCYRCGTPWSRGWYPFKEVQVKIGDRITHITLHVCNDCASTEEKNTNQVTL